MLLHGRRALLWMMLCDCRADSGVVLVALVHSMCALEPDQPSRVHGLNHFYRPDEQRVAGSLSNRLVKYHVILGKPDIIRAHIPSSIFTQFKQPINLFLCGLLRYQMGSHALDADAYSVAATKS